MTPAPAPEFSRPVAVERLEPGAPRKGEATAEECAALRRRYGVPDVRALRFTAAATPWARGGWRVDGVVEAELTQTCVVSLEPVETRLSEPFRRFYAPPARLEEAAELLDPDGEDEPEALPTAIDFGEIAAEAAALAIDPYPRRAEAAFPGVLKGPPGVAPLTDEAARPFSGLAALKPAADGGPDGA